MKIFVIVFVHLDSQEITSKSNILTTEKRVHCFNTIKRAKLYSGAWGSYVVEVWQNGKLIKVYDTSAFLTACEKNKI